MVNHGPRAARPALGCSEQVDNRSDVHLTCSLDPGLEETDTRPWILTNNHAFQASLRHFVTCDILSQVKKNLFKATSNKLQASSLTCNKAWDNIGINRKEKYV